MSKPSLFVPDADDEDAAEKVRHCIAVIDAFTERFNNHDHAGVEKLLHFPHIILLGEELSIWETPGQVTAKFFDELAATGWTYSRYLEKRPVLVSPRKVHFVVVYTRNRADGSVITHHENLWILTKDQGRWGIKQRSY